MDEVRCSLIDFNRAILIFSYSRPLLGKDHYQLWQTYLDVSHSVDYGTDELISKTIRQ